ncbi:C2 domain [Popillia japonica]|uniref:C2 domain n=1 Tax=Popillia japonica TaxID=7064 RepID=A0AAW1IRW4_POPJA
MKMSGMGPASCWVTHKRLESWARAAKERALGSTSPKHNNSENGSNSTSSNNSLEDFNVAKEHHIIQPPQNSSSQAVTAELMKTPLDVCSNSNSYGSPHLQHQSKSYPGGQPLLCRTPSVSSQSSLDSGASRQGHRGSSPQIRTFAPDGRTTTLQHQEAAHSSSYPLRNASRSPSPLRAASLDIRCSSPGASVLSGPLRNASRSPSPLRAASLDIRCSSPGASVLSGELRTPSPSQSSLTSLTGGSVSSTCNSPAPASPRTAGLGRCLSPLLIPSRGHTPDVGAPQPPASPLGAIQPDVGAPQPPASPLGAIQPDLYTRQDGPLFIGGSPKYGPSLGRLHFRLKYDFDKSDLVVHLIEAHDLAGSDQGGFNDPYVRISLAPEVDTRKRQTVIHRNDPNPFFDQHFKFPVSHEDLQSKTLILQVRRDRYKIFRRYLPFSFIFFPPDDGMLPSSWNVPVIRSLADDIRGRSLFVDDDESLSSLLLHLRQQIPLVSDVVNL